MKLIDTIRSVLRIRVQRRAPPPGPLPQVGSSIVRDKLRIRIKHPIDAELWCWLSKKGWRKVDMRINRRNYTNVPDHVLDQLSDASETTREEVYQRFFTVKEE